MGPRFEIFDTRMLQLAYVLNVVVVKVAGPMIEGPHQFK
jgi:hypothetical protein